MNNYTKISAFAMALCMALSSCSGKSTGTAQNIPVGNMAVTEEHPTEMAAELLSGSYKGQAVKTPEGLVFINAFCRLDSGEYVISGSDLSDFTRNADRLYIMSADMMSYKEIEPEFPEEFTGADQKYAVFFSGAGNSIYAVCDMTDHGGVQPPENPDEYFDYEEYERSGKRSIMICTFDTSGKLINKVTPEGIFNYQDDSDMTEVRSITADGDDLIILVNYENILRLSPEGKLTELALYEGPENGYISCSYFVTDASGGTNLCVQEQDFNEIKSITKILPLDADTGKLGEPLYTSSDDFAFDGSRISSGRGEYLFFVPHSDGLYGIKKDGSAEFLLDWHDADMTAGTTLPVGDDEYLTVIDNSYSDKMDAPAELVHLVRRDISEVEDTKVITLASLGEGIADSKVNEFNRSQSRYRINLVDYSQYSDPRDKWFTGGWNQLKLDIIAGKAPDIVISSEHGDMMELAEKGAFADMYPFMESDNEVSRDTIMPNILKLGEGDDGRLYTLSRSFYVETIAAKKKFGMNENWTISEMLDFYDNAPATADLMYKYSTKEEVFEQYFDWTDSLIDSKKGTCDFDCEDFIRYLEFCSRFPDKLDEPEKYSDEWESVRDDRWFKWPADRDITEAVYLSGDCPYTFIRDCEANEDITFVGYPSDDGSGGRLKIDKCMAISSTCPEKEGAWQFIRSYLTKDVQSREDEIAYGFSVRHDVFADQVESMKHFTDENGEPVDYYGTKGDYYYPLTDEEAEWFTDYVMNCYKAGGEYDKDVYAICLEEAQAYFSGENTVEQAAEMIQNRASIVISEKS